MGDLHAQMVSSPEEDVVFEESGCKILIVDDDVATSRMLAQLLIGEGHRTSMVHDGLDALLMVEQDPPDLILLDLELPAPAVMKFAAR